MKTTFSLQSITVDAELKKQNLKPANSLNAFGSALLSLRPFSAKKHIAALKQKAAKCEDEIAKLKWELVQKNELVKSMSFHQSHMMRRPLANILGIIEIINHTPGDTNNKEIQEMISLLKISADELDRAIKHNSAV